MSSKKTKKASQKSKKTEAKSSKTSALLLSVAPFAIFAVSVFFETCLILGGSAGKTGSALHGVLLGLFGYAAHLLCIGAIILAFFFKELRSEGTMRFKLILASLLTVFASSFNSLVMQNGMADASLSFVEFYTTGALGQSGGVFGGFFGIILSKLLTPRIATVISAVVALALFSFTAGLSRLGLWKGFNGQGKKRRTEQRKTAQKEAKETARPVSVPSVSAVTVNTVISETPRIDTALPELSASEGLSYIPMPGESAPKSTSSDLMEQLGLRSKAKEKPDIYADAPKPAQSSSSGGYGYSPFEYFGREEDLKNRSTSPLEPATAPVLKGESYSPFDSPLKSIADRKTAPAQPPKNDYEVWKQINEAPVTKEDGEHVFAADEYASEYESVSASSEYADGYTSEPIEEEQYPVYDDVDEPELDDAEVYTEETDEKISEPVPEAAKSVFDTPVYQPAAAPATKPTAEDDTDEENTAKINPFSKYTRLRYPRYHKPPTDLLDPVDSSGGVSEQEIYEVQSKLHDVFKNFNVNASVTGYSIGPSITRYEITPGPGVKARQISALGEDISLALQSEKRKGDIRIVTVQGKSVMGVEVPNSKTKKVSLRALIENKDFRDAKSKITACIGLTVSGKPVFMNIDDMPHVLVAGQTKSGKSVAINCMIISLIYRASPDEVQLLLIDPKRVELSIYNDIPHMVMPVIDDPKRAAAALKWAVAEMERRYDLLNKAHVRNRDEYYLYRDQNPDFEYMPQIVIIIDELADLMLQVKEHVESLINRLAAMARACGMHIIIGTQRPSVDVVTGLIKANIPTHIAFKVASNTDSKVILGNIGAEKLLGRGDMLYHPTGSNQIRAQGAFVDTPEIKRILNFIIEKNGKAEYDPEIMLALQEETDKLNKVEKKSAMMSEDFAIDGYDPDFDLLCQAAELVLQLGKVSKNVIQRRLNIGFNRTANIVDKLVDMGFMTEPQGQKPGEVLIDWKTYEEWKNNYKK